MSEQIHLHHLWYKIAGVQFGFYQPFQVRKASVKQITNPVAFDANKVPNINGLYDPSMGVSPNDRSATCITCGHAGLECSGHIAHIQMILPVYNPLVIDKLLQLLRIKCFECHKLRISRTVINQYEAVLGLVQKGMLNQALEFKELKNVRGEKTLERLGKEKDKSQLQKFEERYTRQALDVIKYSKYQIEKKAENLKKSEYTQTNAGLLLFNSLIKDLYKQAAQKCPHCLKNYKAIKKQGASKIFVIHHDKKEKRKKSGTSTTKGDSSYTIHQSEEINEQKKQKKKQKYINPREIYHEIKQLWRNQSKVLDKIYGNGQSSNTFNMFFLNVMVVPPNRFRPENKLGEQKYLHDHTIILTKILILNNELKNMIIGESLQSGLAEKLRKAKFAQRNLPVIEIKKQDWFNQSLKKLKDKTQFINKWLELQDSVNCFLDATKSSKVADRDFKGIRQILEKKQGLFRMKMMGKRVNYAARSVISPDPSLQTDEVGLPIFMAKKVSFPEPVNEYNSDRLKQYIINGKQYPGASYIEQNGKLIKLEVLTEQQRISHARNLLINAETKTVYRHLMTGDNVLFNRQPTLHKPGLMAHRVRVLPREQTLRMNYANCKSYNADFDGDEMNLHALQNYPAKAQAELCITDRIYTNPTNGRPIRELIQDSVISAVYLTLKDTFLTKSEYTELLYQSTFALFQKKSKNCRIFILKPAIMKPKQLWTGKQLISNIIKLIVQLSDHKFKNEKGLMMKGVAKISQKYLPGDAKVQDEVLVFDNELLKGILTKNQIGSGSDYGLIHSFNELYGYQLTGQFFTCLTKLFTCYLQMHGFTCGLDDLILKKKMEANRKTLLNQTHTEVVREIAQHLHVKKMPENIDYVGRSIFKCDQKGNYNLNVQQQTNSLDQNCEIVMKLRTKMLTQPNSIAQIDGEYQEVLNEKSSKIIDQCLGGLIKRFPYNNFSMMTVTGAKGSNINHSQVSVLLGQQALEGKRVPMMISGKTLPCFIAHDPNPRAYGYISDRFLTGLRQQQFFFHCMAGRQGLIDTAVKTSRSGYLQRCLMKHLESLKIQYDYSVRDADGGLVQFYYGQDGIDPAKQKFLEKYEFLEKNKDAFNIKYQHAHFKKMLKNQQIRTFQNQNNQKQTILNRFPMGSNLSISNKTYNSMNVYLAKSKMQDKKHFEQLFYLKYLNTIAHPGQSVGCTAAQAIGEPSTQMTLNTFHLAGHGGVNLTLGIPRLRQILMTSTDKLKTPIMELFFKKKVNREEAYNLAQQLQKVKLIELIKEIEVKQSKLLFEGERLLTPQARKRIYNIKITYQEIELIEKEFHIKKAAIEQKLNNQFLYLLLNHILRVQKKNQLKTQIKKNTVKNDKDDDMEEKEPSQQSEQQFKTKTQETKKQQQEQEELKIKKINDSPFFDYILFQKDHCILQLKVPLSLKKFLMTHVIEKFLKLVVMKEVQDINRAIVLTKGKNENEQYYIQTQGTNLKAISNIEFINKNTIASNDIQAIVRTFGIEAGRAAIIKQIVSVFGVYGVTVDYRHLYLIADYMTFPGVIKAMNRNWMAENISPFLKMSFERSVYFLTSAASYRQIDRCKTPSSQIVLGLNPTVGTGVFDLLMDVKFRV